MKYLLPAIALGLLVSFGCASKKPESTQSVMDLTSPTTPTVQPAPAAYTPMPAAQPVSYDPTMNASPTMTATPAAGGNTYTVKPGDTLWKIAASHYGDGKKWQQIVDANPGLTPSKLKIGQTITLP